MHLFGAALPQFLDRKILKLRPPDYGIFANNDPVALDDLPDGDQFHHRDQIAYLLRRRGIASAVTGRVLDQGTPVRLFGFHRVTNGMGDPRIRDTGYDIHLDILIALGQ